MRLQELLSCVGVRIFRHSDVCKVKRVTGLNGPFGNTAGLISHGRGHAHEPIASARIGQGRRSEQQQQQQQQQQRKQDTTRASSTSERSAGLVISQV
jgi:hypothetical protein